MSAVHPNADKIARKYLGRNAPLNGLGWGVDGVVYLSPSEPTAVKVHTRQESFARELAAYERLSQHRITEYQGFNVPRLIRHNPSLRVIEMSVVKPPFLLDFAAATLDRPRDFPQEVEDDWWDRVRENFGPDFDRARDVYWGLVQQFGIYYYDLKPGNLQLR